MMLHCGMDVAAKDALAALASNKGLPSSFLEPPTPA
jgi:hypothetical protein